jgi:hypothetical protein
MSDINKSQAIHWCFTLNNPGENFEIGSRKPEFDYLVMGREVGSEKGTAHIQGYIACSKRMRLSALKKWIPRAHFQVCKGTPEENADYCKKSQDFEEWGVLPAPQFKNGGEKRKKMFEEAYQTAKEGKRSQIDKELLVKYGNEFRRIENEHRVVPATLDGPTSALWVWGAPGVGKSRYIRETFSPLYVKTSIKWFDDYEGEDYILIEDVDPSTMDNKAHLFKIWFDRYQFRVEVKGGSQLIRPKLVIVTSNYSIEECFDKVDATAILRRCEVMHFN